MRHAFLVVVLFAVVLAAAGWARLNQSAEQGPADLQRTLVHDGWVRDYRVHLPPQYDGRARLPVVLVLHGGGGSGAQIERVSGMSALADAEGFVAVYPNGTGPLRSTLLTWNAGNCCGSALDNQVDDVGFIAALLDELAGTLAVDSARVFVTGISNGGMMTYRLGCELSDRLAAIAPVAGALNVTPCVPSAPLPVVAFHGTDDLHVLYGGGVPVVQADSHPRTDTSVADSTGFWAARNGCPDAPQRQMDGEVILDRYEPCASGAEVWVYTLVGGQHSWPGGLRGSARGDPPFEALSASEAMWAFFQRQARAGN